MIKLNILSKGPDIDLYLYYCRAENLRRVMQVSCSAMPSNQINPTGEFKLDWVEI